jgi:rusticyanin
MSKKWAGSILILSLLLFTPLLAGCARSSQGNGGGYSMMGGYGGGYSMMGGYGGGYVVKDDKTAESDMAASLANATVDKISNTITYAGKTLKIVMFAGPPEYADEKFVIGGLINPTLRIPQGANVTMEIINEDNGMPHGVVITSANPPYASTVMMRWIYPGTSISPIPEASSSGYPATQASFVVSEAGTYYYLCQYPVHAAVGMYGQIIIGKI